MTIEKKVNKTILKHRKTIENNKLLDKKIKKYNQLLEKGYIKKQVYSISRLDTIGYSLHNQESIPY